MSLLDVAVNIGFALIFIGILKLGKGDSKGFLYQSAGAFTMIVSGFFMRDAGLVITGWNVAFGLAALVGYWRLNKNVG